MKNTAIAVLVAVVVSSAVVAFYRWWTLPTPEVRLVCKSADKPFLVGQGHVTYSGGIYRFTDANGIESTYNKSEYEACVTLGIGPDDAP